MACGVTLKRALDLDGLHSPDHGIKRRRTSNLCHHSPYHPAASGFASQQQQSSNTTISHADRTSSVFDPVSATTKVSSDELHAFLRKELHLLRKRRAPNAGFMMSSSDNGYVRGPDSPCSNSSSDSDSEQQPNHHNSNATMDQQHHDHQQFQPAAMEYNNGDIFHNMANVHNVSNDAPHTSTVAPRDKPLFSFTQVRNICERLLKEQEARLTNEYDKLLNTKLAEQHEAFVRFTYDQIHRRLEDSPMSYLS